MSITILFFLSILLYIFRNLVTFCMNVEMISKKITDDNLKEDLTTRYSFCNRFSCFEEVKMAKNACIFFLLLPNSGKTYAIF